MKTIESILFEENKTTIQNTPKLKETSQTIRKSFELYGIKIKIEDEISFFEALINAEGLKNKQCLESTFEAERHDLSEIWSNITYQERNKLVNIKINDLKNGLRYFKSAQNKVIWIPFFDELLNALYHNEIAIFELDQYFRLYKQFKDRIISVRAYGLAPYTPEFLDITSLVSEDHRKSFYYHPLKSIFILEETFVLRRIPLSRTLCQIHPMKKDLVSLVNGALESSPSAFLDALIASPLISDKSKLKLKKVFKKNFVEKEAQ